MKKLISDFIITYDDLADTLYISFNKQYKATNTFLDDNFVIVRKKEDKICGITIDGYKDRHIDKSWNDNLILKYLPNFELNSLRDIV